VNEEHVIAAAVHPLVIELYRLLRQVGHIHQSPRVTLEDLGQQDAMKTCTPGVSMLPLVEYVYSNEDQGHSTSSRDIRELSA
jgi:hypothetical protein